MSECISCRLAEATLEHRQDSSKRFCGNECYQEWKQHQRLGGAGVAPIGEGVFMRMLRAPVPLGTGAILTKDLFWKIMSYQGMTDRILVHDIGDTSFIRRRPEIYYVSWRKNVKQIVMWIMQATDKQIPLGPKHFLMKMLWISIREDFIDLRNILWKQLPMLHNIFIDFDDANMIEMMARHFPQPLWESIQRMDPLSIKHADRYVFAAASAPVVHSGLIQYFGKYYTAEVLYKLLQKTQPLEGEPERTKELLQNTETYVSSNDNELYGFSLNKMRMQHLQNVNDPLLKYLEEVLELIEMHPKFKLPVKDFMARVFDPFGFGGDDDDNFNHSDLMIKKFVPRYSNKDILEIFKNIVLHSHGTEYKEYYVEVILENISNHVRLAWDLTKTMIRKEKYAWILEKLISRNLIGSIDLYPNPVNTIFTYVELYGAEDVPRFIQFVVLYQKPRVDFSGLLLIDVGRVLKMGPASKLLMQEVLKHMPSSTLQLMDNEFRRRIRETYNNDNEIDQLLWKDDDSLMEPEQKKVKN